MPPTIDHIIATYGPVLWPVCLGYARDEPEARDLLQEVYVNVWRRLDGFRGEAALKTWLYRVAVNTCLMHRRKRVLKTVDLDQADACHEPASDNPQLATLRAAIRRLPRRDRLLILLYLEDLSYGEISAVTGESTSNVGVRLHRIRKTLTQLVQTTAAWNP